MNKPLTENAQIYAVDSKHIQLTKESLVQKYPMVFGSGTGLLEGEYHIRVDPEVDPVQHAPRRVPVAVRQQLKSTLDDLVVQDIIVPVTQPTRWISSSVVIATGYCVCL